MEHSTFLRLIGDSSKARDPIEGLVEANYGLDVVATEPGYPVIVLSETAASCD